MEEDDLLLVVREKILVLMAALWVIASVNFDTLRSPIAFAVVNP